MRDINDRSIRNISVTHNRRPARETHTPAPKQRRPRRRFFWILALGVIAAAAVLGLLLSTVFAGATVSVVPKRENVTLPASVTAQLEPPVGGLMYQTFSTTQWATTSAPASGSEEVKRQASGQITIRNTGAAQRLIANTRFEASDGKIYRIRESVNVPAGTAQSPGTATAVVYADSPGTDYNRGGTTAYTVPGFKGDPRYTRITATSGPIGGGFTGTQPKVSAADLSKAKAALQTQLGNAVRSALMSQVPSDYQIVEGSIAIVYGDTVQGAAGSGSASVSQSATATGALVRVGDLAATVAKMTVPTYKGEAVTFAQPGNVDISATTSPQTGTLVLLLSGSSPLVWVFDPNALKDALVGQSKSRFEEVIKGFEPAITKADATIRPFWTGSFPTDPSDITIKIKLGN